MASIGLGRKRGVALVASLISKLNGASSTSVRCVSVAGGGGSGSLSGGVLSSDVTISHTAKWMQDTSKKSPMELINEVPPIKVEGRIVACEGDNDPALGHPIEFICLDLEAPAICKYCGLRYVQDHGAHHH